MPAAGHRSLPALRFTHSRFAKVTDSVARGLFIIGGAVLLYTLLVTEWKAVGMLPVVAAIPAVGLLFVPSGIIAVTAFFLMGTAHCAEYLARISGRE